MKRILIALSLILAGYSACAAFEHPWAGKKVAYLGDSITDPGTLKGATIYWGFLEQWLNITPYVYGVGGHQWSHIPGQMDRLTKERGDDFDAIIIFIGTNDFNASIPIGEWFTEEKAIVNVDGVMVKRKRRVTSFDPDTYKGRINIALDGLKKRYPTKQIVLMTPIHRGPATFGEDNIQPTEDFQNGCGEYLDAYIDAIKEASGIWSVPVIDTYSLCGLYPAHKEQEIYVPGGNDWLHPNEKGHERLAKCLMYQLLTIPCVL